MSEEDNLARSYSLRAEELRTLADLDEHIRTREMLMQVARDYDRMARSIEAIDQTNKSLCKS